MEYLFLGSIGGNAGPSNVNKGIVPNLSEHFRICAADNKNKVVKYLLAFWQVICCKAVVVSGVSKLGVYTVKFAKLLHKKTIYIMHGCYDIETILNEDVRDPVELKKEQTILHTADLILPVSKRYAEFIQEKYPFCKGRTSYLHNGVEKIAPGLEPVERVKGSILTVGGDRKLKNNILVANAVAKLYPGKKLPVYGQIFHPERLPENGNIELKGLISQAELYTELRKTELYVLNSIYEPFALSVFDALVCGCSVLVTQVAGALELLDATEHDIIYDPMNEEEIAEKIEYLLQHPNNERLMKGLNFEEVSFQAEAKKLEKICEEIMAER